MMEDGQEKKVLRVTMHGCQVFNNVQKQENRGYFSKRTWTVDLPQDMSKIKRKTPR